MNSSNKFASSKVGNLSSRTFSLPKLPTYRPAIRNNDCSKFVRAETSMPLSFVSNQNDLENIVDNLTTIAKRSEQTLIGTKKIVERKSLRRASSLHLDENDFSSRTSTFNNENHPRRSVRHIEKFSGIKCSLPANKTTIPKTCKTFEKYSTPTKTSFSSSENGLTTPTTSQGQVKSPWRLRFEKFLNHQQLTPLSPEESKCELNNEKIAIRHKQNRTPSFRPPARRSANFKFNQKTDH